MGSVAVVTHHVLVVDDDPTVSDVVRRYLEQDGCRVRLAGNGEAALAAASAEMPDIVVLDLMMPGIDGIEVCRRLRRDAPDLPVVMLTALGEEPDRVLGLEAGADDYVTKPFSPRELTLRIRSILRRAGQADKPQPLLVDGDLVADTSRRVVTIGGAPVRLTKGEFDLLVFLMSHAGRTWTHQQLLERVWGWSVGETGTVTTAMARLRAKIQPAADSPQRIITSYGAGYRFERVGGHA
ncbi:DNA-binding response OmpR family regulator [Couchioplanes caeruleus]|uniref:DNA-binding response regulator n=2 Tax=Couchioplanes caeruleus TaxID=56438 RepID=A0A1K0FA10_9ACTN|nr:DNA-binding response regulator [Couchioplanes caeruleus subsp. caeruleus]ROP30498.1 DNA-binding response OmpR family regulator [Couchioplanes caeruleus]